MFLLKIFYNHKPERFGEEADFEAEYRERVESRVLFDKMPSSGIWEGRRGQVDSQGKGSQEREADEV